jgi:hypothetical protein
VRRRFFWQLSGKQKALECARTLHYFSIDGYVRFESKVDTATAPRDVRFTPQKQTLAVCL